MSLSSSSPHPVHLGDRAEPTFAFFHQADGPARDVAVVLCPPFGWEDMCSYRGRREWASSLAAKGFATLRIDLPGSGDSGGQPRDPARLTAWTDAVAASAQWLSSTTGASRILAIGIGLGGLLAYRATVSGAPIDDLVLWGVSARGRRHVRELKAFSYMELPRVQDTDEVSTPVTWEDSDGSLVVAGYVMSAETQRELDELDLAELDSSRLSESRVLMLERDSREADPHLRAAIERSGAQLTVSPGEGYAAMMMTELPHSVPSYSVFDTVASWLAHCSTVTDRSSTPESASDLGSAAIPVHVKEIAARSPTVVRPPAAVGASPARGDYVRAESVEISMPGGVRLRETPITISDPFGDPFGILTEPLGPAVGLCAVWLNAGPQRRTGPNRMWVETARRWAAQGVPTFRVDLAGIGDAEGDSDALLDLRSYFVPAYLEQVRLVLDTLQARGLPARFILGGLCAGGYWALQVAQEDDRVSAAAALNPGYLVYDGGLSKASGRVRALGPRLLMRSTWSRALRGQVTPSVHLAALRKVLGARGHAILGLPSRTMRHRDAGNAARSDVERAFDRLLEQDRRALILFAGEEQLYTRLVRTDSLTELDRWPNVTLEHIAAAGDLHTLRPLSLQRDAHRLVDELLQGELALLDSGSPADHRPIASGL